MSIKINNLPMDDASFEERKTQEAFPSADSFDLNTSTNGESYNLNDLVFGEILSSTSWIQKILQGN